MPRKRRQHASRPNPASRLLPGRRVAVVVAVLVAIGLSLWAGFRSGRPASGAPRDLPAPDLAGLPPPIATKIREATAELKADPESAQSWGRLGAVFEVHGLYEEAIGCYQQAARLDGDDYRWPYFLGICHRGSEQAIALKQFARAAELNPDDPNVRACLAQTLLRVERLDEAEVHYRAAADMAPKCVPALVGLGRIALIRADNELALDYLRRADRLAPGHDDVHRLLAQAHRRLGQTEAADKVAGREATAGDAVLLDDPVRRELWWRDGVGVRYRALRAKHYLEAGRPAEALAEAQQAVQDEPDSAQALFELARVYNRTNRPQPARESYRKAILLDPDHAEAHAGLGVVLAGLGRAAEAIAHLEAALRLDSTLNETRNNLGGLLVGMGRIDEALEHLRAAADAMPRSPDVRTNLARALQRAGRPAEAIVELRRLLDLRPDHLGARRQLGVALAESRRHDEAVSVFRALVADHPKLSSVYVNLGFALVGAGRHPEAAEAYRAGLRRMPDDPTLADRLAWLLATCPEAACRSGPEAVRLAEAVCNKSNRTVPRFLDTLAAAYAETGDFTRAVATASRALELIEQAGGPSPRGRLSNVRLEVRRRLEGYRAGRAYRDRPAPGNPPG